MAGFTNAYSKSLLDANILTTDKVQWSENGSSVSANLAATTISAWDAATTADPAVRSNTSAIETAAASGAATISHWALFDTTLATQKTDWTALSGGSETLGIGDKLSIAAGALDITLT